MTPEINTFIAHCKEQWEKDHAESFYTACKELDVTSMPAGHAGPYDYLHRHAPTLNRAEVCVNTMLTELLLLWPASADNADMDRIIQARWHLNIHVAALLTDAFIRIRTRQRI